MLRESLPLRVQPCDSVARESYERVVRIVVFGVVVTVIRDEGEVQVRIEVGEGSDLEFLEQIADCLGAVQ